MKTQETAFDGYQRVSSLDFAENKTQLAQSYLLRVIGLAIFTPLFFVLTRLIHPEVPNLWRALITIDLPGMPGFVSILLIILAVVLVLTLHELIHAAVFYLDQRVPPRIGIRGPVIFAAAPGTFSKRQVMNINATAPFTVISLLGLLLIAILPTSALAWVFFPTVINAAASGGDFMTITWMGKQPKVAAYEDIGDVLTAYQPIP